MRLDVELPITPIYGELGTLVNIKNFGVPGDYNKQKGKYFQVPPSNSDTNINYSTGNNRNTNHPCVELNISKQAGIAARNRVCARYPARCQLTREYEGGGGS